MKKVKLNLKRGVRSWSVTVYDSVESAFYLKDEPLFDDEIEEYRRTVTLLPGEFLEMEWIGSEWVYNDEVLKSSADSPRLSTISIHKFDNVRIGKSFPIKGTIQKTSCVELYSGWVDAHSVQWREDPQRDVRITPIKGRMRSKFDFSKLFSDTDSSDDVTDVSQLITGKSDEPSRLN